MLTSSRRGLSFSWALPAVLLHAIVVGAWNVGVPVSTRGPAAAGLLRIPASRLRTESSQYCAVSMSAGERGTLRPVVLCPAQFGTAEDYDQLKADLRERGFALYPAPLRRFDWLRIVPATLTKEFFTASLRPAKTLGFFYEALDKAFQQVEEDFGPDVQVAVLGHSIGGWVARSYIGEVLLASWMSARQRA